MRSPGSIRWQDRPETRESSWLPPGAGLNSGPPLGAVDWHATKANPNPPTSPQPPAKYPERQILSVSQFKKGAEFMNESGGQNAFPLWAPAGAGLLGRKGILGVELALSQ